MRYCLELDQFARQVIAKNFNMAVPWYLSASYAYYKEAESIISDEFFDSICRILKMYWSAIDHPHKYLIREDSLDSGTGYYLDYDLLPLRTRSATQRLILVAQGKIPLYPTKS